jgi:hypothetical protein
LVVVYDASVLYPSTLRDLLIRLAQSGLVTAKWTDRILDEVFDSLTRDRPDLDAARLLRTRTLMVRAVRDCLVQGWTGLVDLVELPDPDDRHVVAAAIRAGAQVIVTANIKDFPAEELEPWGIEPRSPDDFVLEHVVQHGPAISLIVRQIADTWTQPPGTLHDVLVALERGGLTRSVAALRRG